MMASVPRSSNDFKIREHDSRCFCRIFRRSEYFETRERQRLVVVRAADVTEEGLAYST